MSVLTILAELLQAIPSWLRKTLLVLFALVVVAEQVCRIFGVELPYDNIDQALVLVGGYLGIQSAANVAPQGSPQPVDVDQLALDRAKFSTPVTVQGELPLEGD